MTISLRHVYLIFALAMIVAFTLHARADIFDGLDESGNVKPGTNCVLCGENYFCGQLSLEIELKRKTLFDACKTANESVAKAINDCPADRKRDGKLKNWLTAYQGKTKKQDWKYISTYENTRPTGVVGLMDDEYWKTPAVPRVMTVPTHSRYTKLESQWLKRDAKDPAFKTLGNDSDVIEDILEPISYNPYYDKNASKYKKQIASCLADLDEEIENDIKKGRKADEKAKIKVEPTTEDEYRSLVLRAGDLKADYTSEWADEIKDACSKPVPKTGITVQSVEGTPE